MNTLLEVWAQASEIEKREFLRAIKKPRPLPKPDALNAIIQDWERSEVKKGKRK